MDKHPLHARNCAALTLANMYDTGDYDDRELIAQSPNVLRAIYDLSDYKGSGQFTETNGALRLARYMRHKQRKKA